MNGAPAEGKFRPCALEHLPHHCEENEIVVQGEAGQLPGSSAHRAAKPAVIRLVELMLTHAQLRVGGLYIAEQASPSSVFIFINIINRRTRYYNKLSVNILNRRKCGKAPDVRVCPARACVMRDRMRGSDSTRSSVQTKYPPRCPPTCGRLCNIRTGGHLCTAGRTVCLMRHRRLASAVPRRTTITYAQPARSEL